MLVSIIKFIIDQHSIRTQVFLSKNQALILKRKNWLIKLIFLCSLEHFSTFKSFNHLCFIFKYDAAEIHLPK